MKDLNYQLKTLCERNQDGSRSTQAERFQLLQTMCGRVKGNPPGGGGVLLGKGRRESQRG